MAVSIQLDQDPSAFYTNLDVISGSVILALGAETSISAINVKLEGECNSRLMGPRPPPERTDKMRTEIEMHKPLYIVRTVFPPPEIEDSLGLGNPQYKLPPGQHTYPFNFKFPINNDCSHSHGGLFNDLTLNLAGVQFRHVKKTLPPSLGSFPGLAVIKYYLKVTVVRPKFYQENLRCQFPIRFMPIEDPRPPDNHEETFARRKQQFSQSPDQLSKSKGGLFKKVGSLAVAKQASSTVPPTCQVEARLPNPAIVTRNEPLPLRVLVQRLDNSNVTWILKTFQADLLSYTEVRALDLTRVETGTHTLVSHQKLNLPLDELSQKPDQNEWKVPSSLWDSTPITADVIPSFETCNISRRFELDLRVGLSYRTAQGVKSEQVVTVPLRIPVKVYSGIRPAPELLARTQGGQHGGPIFPRPSQGQQHGPSPAVSNTPTAAQSAQPAELDIPDEAPPSYDDVMAEDLAPAGATGAAGAAGGRPRGGASNQSRRLSLNGTESDRVLSSNSASSNQNQTQRRSVGSAVAKGTSNRRGRGNVSDPEDDTFAPGLPARTATGKSEFSDAKDKP